MKKETSRLSLTVNKTVRYVVLILFTVLCLFPFYLLFINATRAHVDIQRGFSMLPGKHFVINSLNVLNNETILILRGMVNSVIVSSLTVVFSIYFSVMTAYAIHAYDFRMKKAKKKIMNLGTLKEKIGRNKGIKKKTKMVTDKKKIRIWTFSKKLLALCLLPMVVVCTLISILSTSTIRDTIDEEVLSSLQIVAASVNEIYTNLYEGDYSVDFVGKVRKGTTEINGNFKLVDALKEKTGFEVSMLFGNTRLITTVPKENGARATGIPTDKEIYKRIEAGETIFLKNYTLLGRDCYVYYDPLINSDGSIIGAIEVVKDSASINTMIQEQINRIAVFSAVFVIIVGLAVSILARGMVARMNRIGKFLQQLIEGRLDYVPDYKILRINNTLC